MQVATGELELRRSVLGRLIGGLVKKMVLGPKPFKPNGPTAKEFVVREPQDFSTAQAEMVATVQGFTRGGPGGLTRKPHPFFGAMSTEDWDVLMVKHLDHHLRQFGV